jgi:hypothetical protein
MDSSEGEDGAHDFVAALQQPRQIAAQHPAVDQPPEPAERRRELHHVPHRGAAGGVAEEVVVLEHGEAAAHHRVAEVRRRVEGGDPRGVAMAEAEVARLPRDLLPHPDQSRRAAADDPFAGVRQRPQVQVQRPRGVEAHLPRRADRRRELDAGRQRGHRRKVPRALPPFQRVAGDRKPRCRPCNPDAYRGQLRTPACRSATMPGPPSCGGAVPAT